LNLKRILDLQKKQNATLHSLIWLDRYFQQLKYVNFIEVASPRIQEQMASISQRFSSDYKAKEYKHQVRRMMKKKNNSSQASAIIN